MPYRAARPAVAATPEPQTPAHISTIIQAFLAEHPNALLLEDGRTLFDLREARLSIAAEHDRATLHLWSEHRNLVRRVLAVTPRSRTLRLTTQRFGQPRPQTLELTPDKHLRTPTARETTRQRYLRVLDRVLFRAFPDDRAEAFRSTMDLERSFGPAYARGTLIRGQNAWAVIAVNASESQATIDAILTIGILWLQHCRDHSAPTTIHQTRLYGGLRLILPCGTAATTLSRLAWLNPRIAQYELYELDETTEELIRKDPTDLGNVTTRLIHAPNETAALARFAGAIPAVLSLLPPGTQIHGLDSGRLTAPPASAPGTTNGVDSPPARTPQAPQLYRDGWADSPQPPALPAHRNANLPLAPQTCELRLRSATELAFLLHGLEFARIRSSFAGQSFNRQLEISVGSGASETTLSPSTEPQLRELIRHLFDRRRAALDPAYEPHNPIPLNTIQDPIFRMQPERWLESSLRRDLAALDPALENSPVYTGVPAFTGSGENLDRGMLDLLAVTRANRLAVIEIKTSEDLQLAFQGLDYWIRVRHHHLANVDPTTGLGDLQQHGYFPETRLRSEAPQLYLVAPALRIHPATETILRHLSPAIPWTLVALDERWRTAVRPIWRKRSGASA